jgi:hypothetical protein
MKKVNTKKIVFWVTLVVLASIIVVDVIGGPKICGVGNLICRKNIGDMFVLLYSIPILFLFSLITYKMRDQVFRAWWNFSRWWVLVIIVVTILLNSANSSGGLGIGGAVSGAFDIFVLVILYMILVIVSLVKIVRSYSSSKK